MRNQDERTSQNLDSKVNLLAAPTRLAADWVIYIYAIGCML